MCDEDLSVLSVGELYGRFLRHKEASNVGVGDEGYFDRMDPSECDLFIEELFRRLGESRFRHLPTSFGIIKRYRETLEEIGGMLDRINYECRSREYTLDEDEMGTIFYCRDLAQRRFIEG